MDYEKAYKKALEQAKKELKTCGTMDCDAARQIFRFFPELRESEDERIRKAIMSRFQERIRLSEEACEVAIKYCLENLI